MNRTLSPSKETRPITACERALHIVALCSVGVTQPVLDALVRNSGYRIESDLRWPEVTGLMALLVVGIPAVVFVADRALSRLLQWFHSIGRNLVIVSLAFMAVLSLLRSLLAWPSLQAQSSVWIATLIGATAASVCFAWVYGQSKWFREWLSLAACGAVLFPTAFVMRISGSTGEISEPKSPITVTNPVPVVLIVFDEFSGLTLMNDALDLNADHFPHFAQLAETATWYRNATSVHARTQMAVPAILSGRFPEHDCEPDAKHYPGNLFEVIAATDAFEMSVCEVYSRLYPRWAGWRPVAHPAGERFLRLVQTMAAVYPRLLLPRDAPVDFPTPPPAWFGATEYLEDAAHTAGRMNLSGLSRDAQLDHFLECLHPSARPRFSFMHVLLPHYPWCYFPSGTHYLGDDEAPIVPDSAIGDLGEGWRDDPADVAQWEHRYRLQVGFVDQFVGRLQTRLKAQGLWDSSLVIVTADHGVSFRPGHSRRLPDAETLPDLLSVPLFVKRPGQTEGLVDDRNVETIDVFPTILDELGIAPPEPVDGGSLLQTATRPRKTFYYQEAMTVVEPTFSAKKQAVQRHRALFGDAPWAELPAMISPRPAWRQRPLSDFDIVDRPAPTLRIGDFGKAAESRSNLFSPALIEGTIDVADLTQPPGDVAIAVNDRLIEVGRLTSMGFGTYGFKVLLPEASVDVSGATATLFHVPRDETHVLQRLRTWKLKEPPPRSTSRIAERADRR